MAVLVLACASVLTLLGGAGSWALFSSRAAVPDVQVAAERLLPQFEQCMGSPAGSPDSQAAFDYALRYKAGDCASPLLEEAAFLGGPQYAYEVMRALMGLDARFDDCHTPAHAIAHGATRKLEDAEVIRLAFRDCTYGYLDGAVMAIGEKNATWSDEKLAGHVFRVCNAYPADAPERPIVIGNCYHGFGHVLWARHKPDIVKVFDGCLLLPLDKQEGLPDAPSQCVGGAAMDYVSTRASKFPVSPDVEFPAEVCALVAEPLRPECLVFTGHEDIEARGDVAQYLEWCASAPEFASLRERCFMAAGTWGGRVLKPQVAFDACSELSGPRPEGLDACVLAIVTSAREATGRSAEQAQAELCARVSEPTCAVFESAATLMGADGGAPSPVSGADGGPASAPVSPA